MNYLIPGRFQPFTLGHLKAYEYAKRQADSVAIGLVVRKSGKMDEFNPFTPEQRIDIIRASSPGIPIVEIPTLFYGEIEKVARGVGICVGEDRGESLKNMQKFFNFDLLIVPRMNEDTSATAVREALRNDDPKTFYKHMHQNVDFFKLREWIDAFDAGK